MTCIGAVGIDRARADGENGENGSIFKDFNSLVRLCACTALQWLFINAGSPSGAIVASERRCTPYQNLKKLLAIDRIDG